MASGNLLPIADQRVEILGFTPQQIRKYIVEALNGDSTRIQKLVQHLEGHPVIEGYCYIPLHVAILVHIFLTMKEVLPTTLHELFCNLVLCCIVRELKTHGLGKNLADLSSLHDLPDDLKSQLSDFCVLAYNGVMEDKVVFYHENLKAWNLPANLPSLGLLQAVEGLTCFSKSLSYNFIHLSVQELLAAYHISHMIPCEQVEIFQNLFRTSRFEAVLHYFCGFTKLANPAIQGYISAYLKENSSFKKLLPILHCFFASQQPSLCQLVDCEFRKLILDSPSLTPMDHLVVGFFINSILCASSDDEPKVELEIDKVDDHRMKLFLSELKCLLLPLDTRFSGTLVLSKPGEGILTLLLKQLPISKITIHDSNNTTTTYLLKLLPIISELKIITREDSGFNIFAEVLQNKYVVQPLHLSLNHVKLHLTDKIGCPFIEILRNNKSVTHFDLSHNAISESDMHHIFQGLQCNTTLVHLDLSDSGILATEKTGQPLIEMLQKNCTLKHLNLSKNLYFRDSGAHCIFLGLQHNNALVYLDLSSTDITATKEMSQTLIQMLTLNKTLKYLNLSNNAFSDSGAQCVFRGLQYNTGLVRLDLSGTEMTRSAETAQALHEMLLMNKVLKYLNLSFNRLPSCIFPGLQQNTALIYLDIRHTAIAATEDTALALSKMLQVNKTLKHLNLSHNFGLSDFGAQCIYEGLQYNNTLFQLVLCNTRITDEGAVHIAQLLDTNRSLQALDISYNNIGGNGFTYIAKSLESTTTLRRLDISHNSISCDEVDPVHVTRQQKELPSIVITVD